MLIDHIFEIKSLDALARHLQASPPRRTQQQLAKLLFENVLYRNVLSRGLFETGIAC